MLPQNDLRKHCKEEKALELAFFCMLTYVAMQLMGVFRLIGIANLVPISLITYRVLDLIFLTYALVLLRFECKLRFIDVAAGIVVCWGVGHGFAKGQFGLTFLNDASIYGLFIAKVVVFRTLLGVVHREGSLELITRRFLHRLKWLSAFAAIVALAFAVYFTGAGLQKYYQAPGEVTVAAASAILSKDWRFAAIFFLYVTLCGKRMLLLSFICMVVVDSLTGLSIKKVVLRLMGYGTVFALLSGVMLLAIERNPNFAGFDKLISTQKTFVSAIKEAENGLDFIEMIDMARHRELVSLRGVLSDMEMVFGAGFGFRYYVDGWPPGVGEDVTNSHFTPLAIVAKLGLIGFGILSFLLIQGLFPILAQGRVSYLQVLGSVALAGLLVQSVFAFGLFINWFTPFLIALASLRQLGDNMGNPSSHPVGLSVSQ